MRRGGYLGLRWFQVLFIQERIFVHKFILVVCGHIPHLCAKQKLSLRALPQGHVLALQVGGAAQTHTLGAACGTVAACFFFKERGTAAPESQCGFLALVSYKTPSPSFSTQSTNPLYRSLSAHDSFCPCLCLIEYYSVGYFSCPCTKANGTPREREALPSLPATSKRWE